jgi:hypothetical protein
MRRGAVALLVASCATTVVAKDYRDASIRVISAPDCVDAANFVSESGRLGRCAVR